MKLTPSSCRPVRSGFDQARAEIEQPGESLLGGGELILRCRAEISENHRWDTIAEVAINEGWSLTFFSDDSVRFAKLQSLWRFSDCCTNGKPAGENQRAFALT
jgi:hypothetical protein